ncbi:MAG: hypothetical protein V3U75_07590 [Methylococcaceae bacterium]
MHNIKIVIGLVCLSLCSCSPSSFFNLKKSDKKSPNLIEVAGLVHYHVLDRSKVLVVVYKKIRKKGKKTKKKIYKFGHLIGADRFFFLLEPKYDYGLVAFDDENQNFRYDKGEPAGRLRKLSKNLTKKQLQNLEIQIRADKSLPKSLSKKLKSKAKKMGKVNIVLGEVANLDSPIFSEEYGQKGFWTPYDFAAEVKLGVYFMEPFSSTKIPILFIYGAAGYPQQWRYFFDNIDRKKYQPWFYYYPSGIRLEKAASLLNKSINTLHKEFGFAELFVAGHDMGGLVGRGFIVKSSFKDAQNFVKLFVSIAAPWDGYSASALADPAAAREVPVWGDLEPKSEYLQSIFFKPLNGKLDNYLFFSYRDETKHSENIENNSVPVHSQLKFRAQQEAEKVLGFDVTQQPPLENKRLMYVFNQLLALMAAKRESNIPKISTPSPVKQP